MITSNCVHFSIDDVIFLILWLKKSPLCISTTFFLSILLLGTSRLVPYLSCRVSAAVNGGVQVSLGCDDLDSFE